MMKKKRQLIYAVDYQNDKIKSRQQDISRISILPGKRRSKNGKIYYEYRKNRSDLRNRI